MTDGKITVLHLCEHFGGAEASLHGVARTFQWSLPLFDDSRFRVLLCSRKGHDKAAEQMIRSGLQPLYLGYGKNDPRNLLRLVNLLKAERVQIIHAHGFGACLWARLAGHLLKTPVIVHGRANYGKVPLFIRPAELVLGPRTRFAFAVSESTRRFMIQKRHIPADAVKVLYNGIPPGRVQPISDERITAIRAAHGAGTKNTVIGVVGRIVSHKGHLDVFRALPAILARIPGIRLWVIGDGGYLPVLQRWARENGQEGRVVFLGFREDVMDYIRCLDVQVFPSHMEGTPNTLFEALAVGNCIVANPVDGQGEILEDGKTALLYRAGDSSDMAAKVMRVIADQPLADRLRKNALARSRDFDGAETVRKMERMYEHILEQQR
jgi:glycosyltransferase involved in cell wall biosynthesis